MDTPVRVFVASSVEAKRFAQAIQQNLDNESVGNNVIIKVTLWTQAFIVGGNVIDELLENLANSDFGIFVFHPDDEITIHGTEHQSTRDNVILELGMFIGKLGKERSLIMKPSDFDLRVPTDLLGIDVASYEAASAKSENMRAELGRACSDIQDAIRKEVAKREKGLKEESERVHTRLNLLIGAALETVCRAMSIPVTPEEASLRVFIFRKESDELVCRYFWDPNPSEENVGVTRFKIDSDTAAKVIVVRCILDKKIRGTEGKGTAAEDVANHTSEGAVQSLPKDFPGVQGRIKPTLRYVLAAPIWNPDGTIWGVVDFDAANANGKKRLQSSWSNSVMVRLAAHIGAVLSGF